MVILGFLIDIEPNWPNTISFQLEIPLEGMVEAHKYDESKDLHITVLLSESQLKCQHRPLQPQKRYTKPGLDGKRF